MSGEVLRELIQARGCPVGVLVQVPSPEIVEIIGRSGYDFAVFDLEHGLFDLGTVPTLVRAAERSRLTAFVRVGGPNAEGIGRVLDFGISGILVPGARSVADVQAVAQAAHYPPDGSRGACSAIRAAEYRADAAYGTHANARVTTVLLIEDGRLMEGIEEVFRVPGVDAVLPGVYDLSVSWGLRGQLDHPRIQESLRSLTRAARAAEKAIGHYVRTPEQARRAREMGASFLIHGIDIHVLVDAFGTARRELEL